MPSNRKVGSLAKNAGIICKEEDSSGGQESGKEVFRPESTPLMRPRLARMVLGALWVESVDKYNAWRQ